MNKEELKQEAEQDAGNVSGLSLSTTIMVSKDKTDAYRLGRFDGYLLGAEPREKRISELEEKISVLLSCKNCPENKGGFICQKEYEDKCLAQKIQYIKELKEEKAKLEQLIKTQDRKLRQQSKVCDEAINRVEILAKENADLKCECRTCVYTDSPCVRSDYPSKDGVCSHYKNVFDENTELTEQNKHLYNDLTMTEAENTELKQENKVLAQNLEDTEILNKTYEKRFNDLEKENTELKKQLEMSNKVYNDNLDYSHHIEGQLTNAKEIIRKFMKYEINEYDGSLEIHFEELKKQAERFLKGE